MAQSSDPEALLRAAQSYVQYFKTRANDATLTVTEQASEVRSLLSERIDEATFRGRGSFIFRASVLRRAFENYSGLWDELQVCFVHHSNLARADLWSR